MEKIVIVKETIPSQDPRLNRHVYHDSRSWNYRFNTSAVKLASAVHARHIGILDQGNVGSCTGNAGIGGCATDPIWAKLPASKYYTLDQPGALKLYSDAEMIDGDGPYPPNDNGSYGISIAKALKTQGYISGYQWTFTLNDALLALVQYPILVGSNWYSGMMTPAKDGRVKPTGSILGGHEYLAREIDAVKQIVWFDNSWGTSWGVGGRFYMTFADFGTLLAQQGDVIVLLPAATQAPAPANSADATLAAAMRAWLTAKGL